ncbi:ABC transporter substrate-binding protein [Salinibaculum salinum]|uniref:ABC transporter substrate-binding protein n=1 Tax=Salinibaculum salinum TaxID=3131996 RepID=UPI0030EBCD73
MASVVGCLGDAGSSSTPSVTYRHRYQRSGLDAAPNDAGVEMGLWEDEGIDVKFATSNGSQQAVKSVAQGNDTFGNAEISAVLRQMQEESSIRIIGQVIDPMAGVVSTEEAGIESWADMEGKTIAQYPFGATGPLAMAALEKAGGNPDNVETRNMQPGSEEALLMEGKADAAITYFPQAVARLEKNGYGTNVLILSDVLENLGVALITRQSVIDDQSETVNRFVRGWLQAHKKFATDLDGVIDVYRDKVPQFDEELARETVGPIYASRVPDPDIGTSKGKGWTSTDQLETTLSVFQDAGLLEETRPVEEYYTNEYIEGNQELAVETAEAYYEQLEDNYDVGPNYV